MRMLHQIARDIKQDWKKPYFGAIPYLDAMTQLCTVNDSYGTETAKIIVMYFLANAGTWKGAKAREIKKELKKSLVNDIKY